MGPLGFACCMHVVANFTGMGDSYDDTTCAERCGPTCFGYGRVINATQGSNGCGICLSPVQNNKTNNDCNKLDSKKFDVATFEDKTKQTQKQVPKCRGKTCLLCNNTSLDVVPKNAFVYITHDCNLFDQNKPGGIIIIDVGSNVHSDSLTFFVQNNDDVFLYGAGPLTINDAFAIKGKGTVHTSFDAEGAAFVVESKRVKKTGVTIESKLVIAGKSDCALTYFSERPFKDIQGDVSITGAVTFLFENNVTNTDYYLAAIANVQGKLTVSAASNKQKVLVLDVNGGSFAVPKNVLVVSVSTMLGVFGKEYEVAYYNDGILSATNPFATANKILLPASLFLLFVWLLNPTFGTGDSNETLKET